MVEVDLEALIARAEEVQKDKVMIGRSARNEWCIGLHNIVGWSIKNGTYTECIAQLKRWGIMPKPKTLTPTLTTGYCEDILLGIKNRGHFTFLPGGELEMALIDALKPYQQSE